MSKFVESFWMALEGKVDWRSGFARALRKPDGKAFKIMDMSRGYTSEACGANNPIAVEPFILSTLLAQQKRILALEKTLGIKQQVSGIPESEVAQEN